MRIGVGRSASGERDVGPLELFFDLVYVFAVSQLSHHLLEHVDLRTGAETLIMTLAVVYGWFMTTWAANWLDPDRLPVRLYLVGLMFASLLMSVAIPDAFDGRAWLFVTGYLLLQIGRATFLIFALRGSPHGEHFVNDLVWELVAGGLWLGGAVAEGDARLGLWGIAVATTYAGVASLHWLPGRGRRVDREHSEIAGGHLVERFRLFFIIVLGETVLLMGEAFTDQPFTIGRLLAIAVAFAGTVALWWCYFQRVEDIATQAADAAADAGTIGLQATWALTLIVIAVIGIGIGDELAIAHPDYDITLGFSILTFGGAALFLLAQGFFLRDALGHLPRSRPLGIAALAILAAATAPLPLIVGIAASTAVLVTIAISDTLARESGSGALGSRRIKEIGT